MTQSDSVTVLGHQHTSLTTLDEAEEADDEYELAFSDPSEFAEAHRSFLLFRSKSPSKEQEKESNHGEDLDEILPAPPLLPPPLTSIVAPSGWDPLPITPQVGMVKCFGQFSVSARTPTSPCIDFCSPSWPLIQLCILNAMVKWVLLQCWHAQIRVQSPGYAVKPPCYGDQTVSWWLQERFKPRSWPASVFMMGIKLHPAEHFTDLCTIQEEDNNDEESRVAFPIIERMEGEARLSRRSSDSDSLNSSYKVSCLSLQD